MINVIGLGYSGLPTALMLASHGVEVIGTDYNKDLVDTLNAGKTTFKEEGLDELFAQAVAKGIPAVGDIGNDDTADWAKAAEEPFWKVGDTIDFIADFYSYSGSYEDSYKIGDPMTVTENMVVSDVLIEDGNLRQSFRFTDLYQQHYWTPALYR